MNCKTRLTISTQIIDQHTKLLVKYDRMAEFIKHDCTMSAKRKKEKLQTLARKRKFSRDMIDEANEIKSECV